MQIAEDFLHFIWTFRLYPSKVLTSAGQTIEVLRPGMPNTHAGPDFSQARMRIAGTLWVGQVEVHVRASEWMLHGHQHDEAYENVILHVVYEEDQPIFRKDGSQVPALVLKDLFDSRLLTRYQQLKQSFSHFPCEKQIAEVDPLYVNGFLSRLMVERFEQKATEISQVLKLTKGDWNETFYIILARSFGLKVNALPFELLASSLPQQVLARYKDQPKCIEALIFGQAGFLEAELKESYPLALKKEYQFLSRKHGLQPMHASLWKFLRMRPQNFPTVRLAQFAALILKSSHLFSTVLAVTDVEDLTKLFVDLPIHPYWENHYHFHKETKQFCAQPGKGTVSNILINAVCQVLFVYGKYTGEEQYVDRAFFFLENLAPEKNALISWYEACGLKIENAYLSQGLLQLNKNYCIEKKCLNCSIGIKILKK